MTAPLLLALRGARAHRSLAAFLASLLLGLSFSSCTARPSPGYTELKHSRDAIRAATGWQSDTTAQYGTGQWVIIELAKVQCPARFDRIAILHEERNRTVHEIWFDGTYYNKANNIAVWLASPASQNPLRIAARARL